jgi:ornithine--oxo-acid transaminase
MRVQKERGSYLNFASRYSPTMSTLNSGAATLSIRRLLAERAGEEMALNNRYLNHQVGRVVRAIGFDRQWVGGEGAHLIDASGERYLDWLGGLGVFAIGRNHPEAIAAIEEVLEARTANLPQFGVTLLNGIFAERLLALAPDSVSAMVTANTGSEAVEVAMKIARAATGRPRILYVEQGFHGLALGVLAINGHPEYREGFGPLLPGCDPVPFGDLDAIERELNRGDVAAVIVEPIQGKGVSLPAAGYLSGTQALCRAAGVMFICDEVQTGVGRTGRFLALEHWNLEPDMICLSKALSAGLVPIAAVLVSRPAFDRVFDRMRRAGRHGSTFASNDLAAAAGLATLHVLANEDLVARAARMGKLLLALTEPLAERYEIVHDVRGLGLMWAIEIGPPEGNGVRAGWRALEQAQPGVFAQLVTAPLFHEHKVLCQVSGARMNIIKGLPPLMIEEEDLTRFAHALEEVVAAAEHTASAMVSLGWRMARHHARGRLGRRAVPPASHRSALQSPSS